MRKQRFNLLLTVLTGLMPLIVAATGTSVAAAAGDAIGEAAGEAAGGRPNILVFLGDDIDWKDYGCYGNDAIRTPHIDALAADGLRFTHAFLTIAQCSPSRISVLTGLYPHATGAEDLHMRLPADKTLVPTYLKQKGYFTGHMLKTHYGPNGNRQFDWYSKQVKEFGDFLDEAKERPFFMWVGFHDAHRPYKKGAFDPPHDPAKVKVPPYLADTPETRADLALYYDEISRMDGDIGAMVAELKKRGLYENTLIVFFGDNGMPFPRAKGTCYDSGVGTPLVMTWPRKIEKGVTFEEQVSVIDLAPTWLDIAGVEPPPHMQGGSMKKLLLAPGKARGREFVFFERNWHNCDEHIRGVRTKKWKLIRNAYLDKPHGTAADLGGSPSFKSLLEWKEAGKLTRAQAMLFDVPRRRYELYDLENDPWETNNLAGAESKQIQEERARLIAALDEWIKATNDFPPTRRRRGDNTDRFTGEKFTQKIPPMTDE